MKTCFLLFWSCVFFLTGCESYHNKQYIVKNANPDDKEAISVILANAARAGALEEVATELCMPDTLAFYEGKPWFKLWLGARMHNENVVIDLFGWGHGWKPPPYKSAETMLFQELPKAFGERLIIDPQPKVPFPVKKEQE